jgi:hypothetical protein
MPKSIMDIMSYPSFYSPSRSHLDGFLFWS